MKSVRLLSNHKKINFVNASSYGQTGCAAGVPPPRGAAPGCRAPSPGRSPPPALSAASGQRASPAAEAPRCHAGDLQARWLLRSPIAVKFSISRARQLPAQKKISALFFMTSKNGVSFHLPKQLRRAAAGAEQQGATSRRDTLRRWKKAGASRPGFQRYSQRAKQWDSQKCSTRQAPPRFAPVHPSSRVSRSGRVSLKLGQNSQDFHSIAVCSWHLTGRDGALLWQCCPTAQCLCTPRTQPPTGAS